MRPVNLIPKDERRGDGAPRRAGTASYILVAVLVAVLLAVTGVVLTGNDIKDKKAELASLEAEKAQAQARASALSEFASFQQMKDARVETVASLAQSRFDWERVIHEVSLVLPETVWLTNLTGTVAPEVTVTGAATSSTRSSITGPALTMIGCARSQQDVAELINAVGDIDGVTRVLVENSEKPTGASTGATGGSTAQTNEDCRTRDFIAKFQLVAAFDSVATGASAPPAPATPAAPAAPEDSTAAATTTASAETSAAAQQAEQQQNVESATDRGRKAAGLIGAGDGG